MKKAIVLTLVALLALGGVQAQTKKQPAKTTAKQSATMTAAKKKTPTTKTEQTAKKEKEKVEFLTTRKFDPAMREIGMDIPFAKVLSMRRTTRDLMEETLPDELISGLLWSAYGINRPEEGKRVVPSACNSQEFDIYLFDEIGIWLYDAKQDMLGLVEKGDHRADVSSQKHFAVAPVVLVLVADYSRMERIQEAADREFYAAVDAGYISQNIYLYCTAAELGTVACGSINRENLNALLDITNGKAILAHPVGRSIQ